MGKQPDEIWDQQAVDGALRRYHMDPSDMNFRSLHGLTERFTRSYLWKKGWAPSHEFVQQVTRETAVGLLNRLRSKKELKTLRKGLMMHVITDAVYDATGKKRKRGDSDAVSIISLDDSNAFPQELPDQRSTEKMDRIIEHADLYFCLDKLENEIHDLYQIYELRYKKQLSWEETAAHLKLAVSSAKDRHRRMINELGNCMEEQAGFG